MSSTDQPMSLAQAFVVADQASPMPQVAHEALVTLRGELLPRLGYESFVADYWRGRRRTDPSPTGDDYHENLRDRFIMTVGLAGEVGEVCELLKKDVRDGHLDRRELAMELGDVLYYLTKIAQSHGLTLGTLQRVNREKLEARREGGKQAYTAEHVVLSDNPAEVPRLDPAMRQVMQFAPANTAADLRRAAGFIAGSNDEDCIVSEAEAMRLGVMLRNLAALVPGGRD